MNINNLILRLAVIILLSSCAFTHKINDRSRLPASHEDLFVDSGLTIPKDKINQIYQALPRLGEDKIAYHWTSIENAFRWGLNRTIDRGEVEFLNRPSASLQAFGPGFYISLHPTNSENYGVLPININLSKDIRIYDNQSVNQILGTTLTEEQHLTIKKKLYVIGNASKSDRWYVINNPDLLEHVSLQEDVTLKRLNEPHLRTQWLKLPGALLKDGLKTDLGHYIQSLFTLIYYQDGLAFERSLHVSPENPWQEFEPERFEAYKNKINLICNNSTYQKNIFKTYKNLRYFGNEKIDNDWVKIQRDQILPSLNPVISSYRTEGVRAGGPGPMQTFKASAIELFNLLANDFIDVHYEKIPDTNDFNVHYFYPDAFHFKHLKSFLSNELYVELLNESPDLLMKNSPRRQFLNQRIIQELLTKTFKKYEGLNVQKFALSFYKELMSIHPFVDGNGRTLRLYLMAIYANTELGLPLMLWSDNDLMKGVTRLNNEITQSSKVINEFMVKYIFAAIKKSPNISMEEFNKEIGSTGLLELLRSEGATEIRELTPQEERLIKERRIVDFKDSYTEGRWRDINIEDDLFDIFTQEENTEAKKRASAFFLEQEKFTQLIYTFIKNGKAGPLSLPFIKEFLLNKLNLESIENAQLVNELINLKVFTGRDIEGMINKLGPSKQHPYLYLISNLVWDIKDTSNSLRKIIISHLEHSPRSTEELQALFQRYAYFTSSYGLDFIPLFKKYPDADVVQGLPNLLFKIDFNNSQSISRLAELYFNEGRIQASSPQFLTLIRYTLLGDDFNLDSKKAALNLLAKLPPDSSIAEILVKYVFYYSPAFANYGASVLKNYPKEMVLPLIDKQIGKKNSVNASTINELLNYFSSCQSNIHGFL